MQAETGGTVCFFTRLFNISSQNNHHTENAKIIWFNYQ